MKSPGLYPIGIVAELLSLHPETLRVWERESLLSPQRRRGFRCYSDDDLRRLLFVKHLLEDEGFNLASARAYLRLYPCWTSDVCHPCHRSTQENGKPCWKQPNTYCALFDQQSQQCTACDEECSPNADGLPTALRGNSWKAAAL